MIWRTPSTAAEWAFITNARSSQYLLQQQQPHVSQLLRDSCNEWTFVDKSLCELRCQEKSREIMESCPSKKIWRKKPKKSPPCWWTCIGGSSCWCTWSGPRMAKPGRRHYPEGSKFYSLRKGVVLCPFLKVRKTLFDHCQPLVNSTRGIIKVESREKDWFLRFGTFCYPWQKSETSTLWKRTHSGGN